MLRLRKIFVYLLLLSICSSNFGQGIQEDVFSACTMQDDSHFCFLDTGLIAIPLHFWPIEGCYITEKTLF